MLTLDRFKTEYISQNNDIILKNIDCFDLTQTLDCGQAFRYFQSGDVWQGVALNQIITIEKVGNDIILHDMPEDEFINKFYNYFSLDFDYASLIDRLKTDETLKKATDFARGIRVLRQDKWEALCSFIISQNNNIPRIKGIINRLCECFGTPLGDGFYDFPSAAAIACLDVNGLSPIRAGFRAKYIIDAARKVSSNQVNLSELEYMPIETARESLIQINGVGPKVAECALLYGFGRFDAFPLDVWIKRVMAILYPNGLPECAEEYKGIAQQYLFHYARINNIK